MNGKVLMLAIIFLGGFHVFYVFNRVQNFANIMNRLCTIQLGECHSLILVSSVAMHRNSNVSNKTSLLICAINICLKYMKFFKVCYFDTTSSTNLLNRITEVFWPLNEVTSKTIIHLS